MADVKAQEHSKFKVFSGEVARDGALSSITPQVESWVKSAKVAPKSIGVEYLEASHRVILSVGYRDDEPGYGVTLSTQKLGTLEGSDAAALQKVEKAMSEASARVQHVICHELYVTGQGELYMIFMSAA
jgi:hypothetical protein